MLYPFSLSASVQQDYDAWQEVVRWIMRERTERWMRTWYLSETPEFKAQMDWMRARMKAERCTTT